jgi:hypothetical protein
MTIHVRWPAPPAELRAGLDFFVTFCIKAKSKLVLHDLNLTKIHWVAV